MQFWTIIADSFRETRDKKLFWVLLGLSTLIAVALACVGFDENGLSFFFGLVKQPSAQLRAGSPAAAALMAAVVSNFLIKIYIGWLGVILCLIGTAGMFPALMEPGAIELVVSKPISRAEIFAAKYAGGLIFVFVQVTYFALLTLLVLRYQLGLWLWPYLYAIPLLVLLFSYLYSVGVLAAVWSRSALTALVVAMVFWFMAFSARATEDVYSSFRYEEAFRAGQTEVDLSWEGRNAFGRIAYVLSYVFPKTGDIPYILRREMRGADTETMLRLLKVDEAGLTDQPAALQYEHDRVESLDAGFSIGSSLIFEGVVLLFAWWRFSRKDF